MWTAVKDFLTVLSVLGVFRFLAFLSVIVGLGALCWFGFTATIDLLWYLAGLIFNKGGENGTG